MFGPSNLIVEGVQITAGAANTFTDQVELAANANRQYRIYGFTGSSITSDAINSSIYRMGLYSITDGIRIIEFSFVCGDSKTIMIPGGVTIVGGASVSVFCYSTVAARVLRGVIYYTFDSI